MNRGFYISYRWIAVTVFGLLAIFLTVSVITAQPPVPHSVPSGLDVDCLSCHQAGVAGAPRLAWDHLGRSNADCQQCHAVSGNLSIPIGHEVEGYEACLDCHLDGSADAPRVAGVHTSYTNANCQTCHPPMRVETPIVQEPEVQQGAIEPQEEVVVEQASKEASEPDVTAMSSPQTDPGCQKCHWQNAEQESHLGVIEAEALPAELGADLFAEHCATCHGEDGETSAFPKEVLAMQALSEDPEAEVDEEELEKLMAETGIILNDPAYLSSRDDASLMQAIIGLDPEAEQHTFASIYGGPLEWADVVALASYIRTWDPVGPPQLQPQAAAPAEAPATGGVPSFAQDIFPILEESCAGRCHLERQRGDWSMETYDAVMTSGENAPVIIPGDPDNSLFAQKLQNTQEIGKQMPLKELLPQDQIDLVLEWIRAGAPDN